MAGSQFVSMYIPIGERVIVSLQLHFSSIYHQAELRQDQMYGFVRKIQEVTI